MGGIVQMSRSPWTSSIDFLDKNVVWFTVGEHVQIQALRLSI